MPSRFPACAIVGILVLSSAAIGGSPADDPHLAKNPLYRELRDTGVVLDPTTKASLPAPLMPPRLAARDQTDVVRKLAGDDYPLEELTRESVVAPYVLKIRDVPVKDANVLGRATSLWFCAHGSFDKLDHRALLDLFQAYRRETKLTFLSDAELKDRGIAPLKTDDVSESYCRASYTLLDRVQTQGTYRISTSRSADSVVLAVRLEPAFLKDKVVPNVWRSLTPDEAGTLAEGPAQPFDGMAMITRITRMSEPKGLLFVESHQAFAEPKSWFQSPNVLRSKLPLVVQSEVRAFRRELLKLDQ